MLRISVLNTPGTTQMKLEGKLAHEWVQEAAKAWSALVTMNVSTDIIVDLLNVSFVDDAGHRLLTDMRHAGAELIGCGPMISALIEEIEETEAEQDEPEWDSPELDSDRKELKR